jgi:hypothetical protein
MPSPIAHLPRLALSSFLLFLSANAAAVVVYDAGVLEFQSSDQSMWGTGDAFVKTETVFVGEQWTNASTTIGGIIGKEDQVIFPGTDPVKAPYYEPRIWVPTPTWSSPFKGYWTGCGCTKYVTVIPGLPEIAVDSRTGAKLDVTSSGKAGIEFGYSIDSGSVDSEVAYSAKAELPDTAITAGTMIDINTSSLFDQGFIQTQSPNAEAWFSAVLELSGSVDATACGFALGCKNGTFNLPTVDTNQRIVSIDPNSLKILDGLIPPDGDPVAQVPLLNRSLTLEAGLSAAVPPVPGFKLTESSGLTLFSSMPPTPSVTVDLAEIEVQVPNIATSGTGSGEKVTAEGRDDLLALTMDVDGAATMFGGLPPAGLNFTPVDAGVFKLEASLDLIDVDAGPVLGIAQHFELIPTLMAEVEFSSPIQLSGLAGLHDSWTGMWEDFPEFSLFEDTTFTPTFWIDAMLRNTMGLDLGLIGTLDVLKLGATAVVGGINVMDFGPISLNNLLGLGNTLFETDKLEFEIYNDLFALGGFSRLLGNSFTLALQTATNPGGVSIGDEGLRDSNLKFGVPLPGVLMLLLAGAIAMRSIGQHRRAST